MAVRAEDEIVAELRIQLESEDKEIGVHAREARGPDAARSHSKKELIDAKKAEMESIAPGRIDEARRCFQRWR